MNSEHKNSRKVTFFRSNNFVQAAQNPDGNEQVADWMSMSSKHISPYWESSGGRIIGSGLTIAEQELLMPDLLYTGAADKDFKKAVFTYFNDIVTKVPFTGGKTLEIGLQTSNDKPVSKDNMPIDLEEYVRYRHAKNHPWVAGNKAEAQGNAQKFFFMHDPELQLREESDKLVLHDEADTIWLSIKEQPSKVAMLLTLMGKDERDYSGRNKEIRQKNDLKELINKKASEFLRVYKDERFETRYWLKAMVNANAVRQVGISYVWGDNNVMIGRSELEALLFLENPENADTVTMLKANTQDALRKPKTAARKRTA